MAIEIRELIIKTQVNVSKKAVKSVLDEKELQFFKLRILEECRNMIDNRVKSDKYTR